MSDDQENFVSDLQAAAAMDALAQSALTIAAAGRDIEECPADLQRMLREYERMRAPYREFVLRCATFQSRKAPSQEQQACTASKVIPLFDQGR